LHGEAGADVIRGGIGDDMLSGGAGADLFIFAAGHGSDRLTDFAPGQDRIQIDIAGQDYAGLVIADRGADTWIDTGGGTILLQGLDPGALSAGDFLFL
ncbi:hypothetical protein ACFMPD_15135, partial [Sedimentitalea sp. HM32M-2]